VCFADASLDTASYASFDGAISFPDLRSSQALAVTSEVGEVLEVSFDVAFTGGDYLCVDTAASGAIKHVNASILFSSYVLPRPRPSSFLVPLISRSADTSVTTLDFVAVIKYATAEGGDCIQVGKFNFFGGNGERCSNYFDWPASWDSVTSGNTYEASVDVSSANYVWPAGVYTVRHGCERFMELCSDRCCRCALVTAA
jgi:hypothetical protein